MSELKLTTYFGERSRLGGRLLADELLDIHDRHGIDASILLRGAQGFGAKHRRRTDRLLTLSEDLPLVCIAVDASSKIERLASEIRGIQQSGLITIERLRTPGETHAWEPLAGSEGSDERAAKLTIYLGRHERIDGKPAFAALTDLLCERGIAGATVLLGVDGTRHGARERARFFARNVHVPMMIVALGDAIQIEEISPELRKALPAALLTIERVTVHKRDGELFQAPAATQAQPPHGRLEKLTIVTSEASRHAGRPVYLELMRRMRSARAAGATSLRGIWGFHGDHAPHGDRLLSLRRHVPILTEVIDTPERIAAIFPEVDELTRERGLVTSETLPPPIAPP